MDVIANAKAGPGTVGFGVYNVWNTDYKSVYSQAVESVYGAISSLACSRSNLWFELHIKILIAQPEVAFSYLFAL